MAKSGLFGGGAAAAPATMSAPDTTAPPAQPSGLGGLFRRGGGGFLPEVGSRAQLDMVQALVQGGMASAQGSNSPLLALLAPMIGGAAANRAQGQFETAEKTREAERMERLMGAMNAGRGGIEDLISIVSSEDTPTGMRGIASSALARALQPPAVGRGGGGGGRRSGGSSRSGYRPATPEEARAYGAEYGQFGPNGRFYPLSGPSGGSSTNDAGVLRQQNEATTIIADAIQTLVDYGMSEEEAAERVAADPIYAPQFRILNIGGAGAPETADPLVDLMAPPPTTAPTQPGAPALEDDNDPLGLR